MFALHCVCYVIISCIWLWSLLRFLGAGQSRQHFNAISYNITGSCCEMLLRSWPNARNTLQHLILFDIVTFLYDTTDFNLSSLPLLPNVSTVRTLNLLLSSIAALVFRALWFNPTLIVDMYRTHFLSSYLVLASRRLELNSFSDCWYSNSCTSGWILFAMSQVDCLHVI